MEEHLVRSRLPKSDPATLQHLEITIILVDDILEDPNLLAGKTPEEIEHILGHTPGWKVEVLGKGSKKGQGWVLREYSVDGRPTGQVIRWHPG